MNKSQSVIIDNLQQIFAVKPIKAHSVYDYHRAGTQDSLRHSRTRVVKIIRAADVGNIQPMFVGGVPQPVQKSVQGIGLKPFEPLWLSK